MARLPANKWVTIGSRFGLAQRLLYVVVDADVECRWRERAGWFTTTSGTFRTRHSFRLFNQTAQIRSPIEASYDVTNYGDGFSYNAAANVTTEAAGTTLVLPPITAPDGCGRTEPNGRA